MIRLALVLFVLAGPLAPAAHAAGAWVDRAQAPTLRQRGWRYAAAPLKPSPATPLAGTAITRVSWQYHYRQWYRGFRVVLCARDVCIDATAERGASNAFAGLPVASVFRFYFMVAGRGLLPVPMHGRHLRLIVNFE